MSEQSSGPSDSRGIDPAFIRRFERRAAAHGWLAGGVFVLIAALVAFAVFVFFNAANIASRDLGRDSTVARLDRQSLELLEAEMEALSIVRDSYTALFEVAERSIGELVLADLNVKASQRRLALARLRDEAGRPIGTELDRPDPGLKDELEITIALFEAQKEDLADLLRTVEEMERNGILPPSEGAIMLAWLKTTELEINLLKSQLAQVEKNGETPAFTTDFDLSSYAPLIQISLTRFGTMIVIFFFISILVPLYRYNMRLRVFYNSLADALLLSRGSELSLTELAPVLSPEWGFDAQPETPTQQAAQMFERVVGAARKG